LVVPSVKYHLPRLTEPYREGEYRYATTQLADAWREPPLLVEKDFSPTLAGDALADDRAQILRWLREVPGRIRAASRIPVRVAVKLMNARFEDAFQVEMMNASTAADALVCFNRLFDAARGVAYGGWDLSDRNLRVLETQLTPGIPGLTGTGNICSGRMILEYARRGCESVQLHTFFQLPLSEYAATHGSRVQRALHALVFHPRDGLIAVMLEREARGLSCTRSSCRSRNRLSCPAAGSTRGGRWWWCCTTARGTWATANRLRTSCRSTPRRSSAALAISSLESSPRGSPVRSSTLPRQWTRRCARTCAAIRSPGPGSRPRRGTSRRIAAARGYRSWLPNASASRRQRVSLAVWRWAFTRIAVPRP